MPTALDCELPVVCFQKSTDASLAAASRKADSALVILPTSEILVWIVLAAVCSCVSGWLSTAISWVMMVFTSSPLPMPGELMLPEVELTVAMPVLLCQCRGRRALHADLGQRYIGTAAANLSTPGAGRAGAWISP